MTAFVKLAAALPADERDGLAEFADQVLRDREQPLWAVVRLDLDSLTTRVRDGRQTAGLRIGHIEVLEDDDLRAQVAEFAAERLADRREITGQGTLDDGPTEIDELLAVIRETADDLNVSEESLHEEFEEHYGVPPKGSGNVVWLKEFIHSKKADLALPPRPVEDVELPAEPVHTSQSKPKRGQS